VDEVDFALEPWLAEFHQAVGMTIGALGLSSSQARSWLCTQAAGLNRDLLDVSQAVVSRQMWVTRHGLVTSPPTR
jgi:hypothetical protein